MTAPIQTCYRHHDRRAGVSCQRCDRPICPDCMVQASVGFHCPECARGAGQEVYTARTLMAPTKPVVTQALIGINVAVFLLGLTQPGFNFTDGGGQFTVDYGLVGSGAVLDPNGITGHLVGVAHGEWYRLITGGFMHAGILHLAFNMFALWVLGSQLEAALGRTRFAVIYMTSLLAGSLGVMLIAPNELTVGASGAIFGLLGAAIAAHRSSGVNIWESGLGAVLLVNLVLTFGVSGISIGGHIGGLAGGLLCGVVLYELGKRMKDRTIPVVICGAIGIACFVAAIAVANAHA